MGEERFETYSGGGVGAALVVAVRGRKGVGVALVDGSAEGSVGRGGPMGREVVVGLAGMGVSWSVGGVVHEVIKGEAGLVVGVEEAVVVLVEGRSVLGFFGGGVRRLPGVGESELLELFVIEVGLAEGGVARFEIARRGCFGKRWSNGFGERVGVGVAGAAAKFVTGLLEFRSAQTRLLALVLLVPPIKSFT